MAIVDDIQDIATLHAHHVERYTTHEVDKIQALIGKMIRELKTRLLDADITEWTKKRTQRMKDELTELVKAYNGQIQSTFIADYKAFVVEESDFSLAMLESSIPNEIRWSTTTVAPAQLWSSAIKNPLMFEGGATMDLKPYLRRVSQRNLDAMTMTLRQGSILGKPSAQIARELSKPGAPLQGAKSFAELVTRTSTNHMATIARREVGKANDDIVSGYTWVSTLDKRTSDVCQSRDGEVWYYDETEREKATNLLEGEVYPPAHYRCRSTTTYILKSWKDLGIDAEELSPTTRASMDGQVPAKQTYRQWLVRQPAAVQKDVLGPTRYDMLRRGEIEIDQFYRRDGRRYTLKQLKAKGFDTLGMN